MWHALSLFVVMVLAGLLFRRLGLVRREASADLNQLVLNLCLPPLIFLAIQQSRLESSFAALPLLAWGGILAGLGLAWLLGKILQLPKKKTAALGMLMAFGNTTFLGYPLTSAFYGPGHMPLAILFDQLGTWIAINTVGLLVVSWAAGRELKPGGMVRKLLSFPPFWALVLGFVLHGAALEAWQEDLLRRIADLTLPLIMFSLGLSLRLGQWKQDWPLVVAAAAVKLALVPLALWGLMRVLGFSPLFQQAAVFQAAMPSMFYSLSLALLYGLEVELVVTGIMTTTLLSLGTLPLWHALLAR